MIAQLAGEYEEDGLTEVAQELYLIAFQRDFRVNEGDLTPFSRRISANIDTRGEKQPTPHTEGLEGEAPQFLAKIQ